ncbi:hypothetical protein [Paenibacillus sp. FSL R7-0128]
MKNTDQRQDSTEPVSANEEELARLQKSLPESYCKVEMDKKWMVRGHGN